MWPSWHRAVRVRPNTSVTVAAAAGHGQGWLAHPSGPSPEEQFSLGLGFLLDGIARCLAGAETQARSDTMGG
jgi:hypothetical protein